MRPLLDELFYWTHSAEGSTGSCLSLLCKRPHRRLFQTARTSSVTAKPWRLPLTGLHLQLPDFLLPLHDVVLTTGVQMRFLASLPQCKFTMGLLTDSALRQMQCMRAGVSICGEEPASCMSLFGSENVSAGVDDVWAPTMGWHAQAVQHASAVTQAGIEERQAAVQRLVSELSDLRAAKAAGIVRDRLQELQSHLHASQLQEQRHVQAQHADRMKRAEELQKRRAAAEEHRAQARVSQGWDRSLKTLIQSHAPLV